MNETSWEENVSIRSYEVDFQNRLRLAVLFHLMQETATNQIARQGVGIDVLRGANQAWVLSRLLLEVNRYPGRNEEIRVKTWPRGIERLFAHRDFLISGADGEILARATSFWLLVDLTSRRPKRLETVFRSMPTAPDRKALPVNPEKLKRLERPDALGDVLASYSQLDVNHHVNNAHYIEWIMDTFPADLHRKAQVSVLQINFLSEVKFGDRIALLREWPEIRPPRQAFEGLKDDGKTVAFQARLEWRESVQT